MRLIIRSLSVAAAMALFSSAVTAQAVQTPKQALQAGQNALLTSARQAFADAGTAGAATTATSLYDEANWRLRSAEANWNAAKGGDRDTARLHAQEAFYAARAAKAKADWLASVMTARNLQSDIRRFGGTSDLSLADEPPSMMINRGTLTRDKIAVAQSAIDQAKAAGALSISDNDLATAEADLKTARTINRVQRQSEAADHLAFIAEMIAGRAYYQTRLTDTSRYVPNLQTERTRLARAASELQASTERRQREEAERQAADLRRQLEAESANRQAQQAELDRLRTQLEESHRVFQARIDQDRNVRIAAEQALDAALTSYEAAIPSASAAEVDALRRQVEDHQIELRTIQDRQKADEQVLLAEIDGLRNDLERARAAGASAEILSQRQQEIDRRVAAFNQLREENSADIQARLAADKAAEDAIARARRGRLEAEAQTEQLRAQIIEAQQKIDQAQVAAQQAQREAGQAANREAELQNRADLAHQQAVQAEENFQKAQQYVQEQAQQTAQAQAQAEQARLQAQQAQQQARQTQEELDRARTELQRRDMQDALARLANTRTTERGLIVTLPGIFFDTGKTALKPGAKNTLEKIATEIKKDSNVKVSVEGHTDSVGSAAKNQTLSEKRAQAVENYLVSVGVPTDKITAAGKGEAEPVATNKTKAGQQQNRRVELVITY